MFSYVLRPTKMVLRATCPQLEIGYNPTVFILAFHFPLIFQDEKFYCQAKKVVRKRTTDTSLQINRFTTYLIYFKCYHETHFIFSTA